MRHLLPLALLATVACTPGDDPSDDDTSDAVDLREAFPEPTFDDPLVFTSDVQEIPPYTEKQFCHFDTWQGDDVGIHQLIAYQNKFGHHFIIAGTGVTARVVPDGETVDCTDGDTAAMESFRPLIIGGTLDIATRTNTFSLPDGMAALLEHGQRYVLQSHYVNASADAIKVQDELQLDTMVPDDVTTWAAPYVHTESDMVIPANADHQVDVTCTWDDDYTLLYLGGHMHEWGTSFTIDRTAGDQTDRIYAIDDWDPLYRDAPPFADFGAEPMQVHAGESFTTHCAWHNDTAEDLKFPSEMCASFGMIYPAKIPVICEQD